MNTTIGFNYVDWADLGKLAWRFALNFIFASIVIRMVYFRLYRSREYVFTYYTFNVITFFLCLLLRKVPAELGFALALFGVFGILRYRTEQIRIRDLTYLFIVIGLGMLNGIANKNISLAELLTVNAIIVIMTTVLELRSGSGLEATLPLLYDQVELLHPGSEAELAADIAQRTGLVVLRVDIQRVDFLRDSAELLVHHRRAP